MITKTTDFFISYNGQDQAWAEWIAWHLEEAGYSVVIQAWDFLAGDNFVLKMQAAATQASRTLAVLSPNYLAAQFTQPEWAAAFAQDPTGAKGILLPVRVAECDLQGLLAVTVYINLVGLEEAAAKNELLAKISRERLKPSVPPRFPGQAGRPPPPFPEPPPPLPEPLPVTRIRDEIRQLLKSPTAKPLHDEIAQQPGVDSVAEALVPRQLDAPARYGPAGTPALPGAEALVPRQLGSTLDALDLLHAATKSCLLKLAEQKPDLIDSIKNIAGKALGWLVLLAVDRDQVKYSECCHFDPWRNGVEVKLPLETEAGTEVLVSSLGNRAAWFDLTYDKKSRPRVAGKDNFDIDGKIGDLEIGIGQTDRLIEIQKCIWVEVMKKPPPLPFGPTEQNMLKGILARRERSKESHYYITVPPGRDDSPLSDQALLQNLLKALPSLRIIYISGGQGEGLLLLDEYELWASIHDFLLMLRGTL